LEDNYKISQMIHNIEQDRTIRAVYGYIIDILTIEEQDFYIALVGPEEANFPADTMCHYIPIDESPESLAASYGPPKDLVGLRVRVDYYGSSWRRGVAHIVPQRERTSHGNASEVPRRGFRYAVAGGGSV
jgi:hypothetical protein